MRRISIDQAKRFALAAQGFNDGRSDGRIDVRHFRKVVGSVGIIQLDSVNVFSRTHYMPFFSRIGAYDRDALDDWLWNSGEMFEYWAHEASLIPVEDHRLWRWMMARELRWKRLADLVETEPEYLEMVLEQVDARGPLRTSDLHDPGQRQAGMWNWSKGKVALEALFFNGEITTASRPNFTRMYDLTHRVIDAEHLGPPELDQREAIRALLVRSASSLGVGTADDLIDYPRLNRRRGGIEEARSVLEELVDADELQQVEVKGWAKPAYLHPDAMLPRKARGTALLSPFDSLVWHRERTERLWDFHYRIEIYVPEPKRVYGYYVLPFLLDGDLVARVDLKAGRRSKHLKVMGAFGEPGIDQVKVARKLMNELQLAASWLGLDEIEISENGDLAPFLRKL